jgi:hypothetical protein
MITKQQLQLINRRTLKYPLDIAEKDYYLSVAVKLINESALGAQVSPEAILVNWQQEAGDDLRSIHTTRLVQDEGITRMLDQLQFEPNNPTPKDSSAKIKHIGDSNEKLAILPLCRVDSLRGRCILFSG